MIQIYCEILEIGVLRFLCVGIELLLQDFSSAEKPS